MQSEIGFYLNQRSIFEFFVDSVSKVDQLHVKVNTRLNPIIEKQPVIWS